MPKKIVRTIAEDRSPETIANVVCIVRIIGNTFSGANVDVLRLNGTVKEKLEQYRKWVGKEWAGHNEKRFTEYIYEEEPISLDLGQVKYEAPYGVRISREAQERIDALVVEADKVLEWNEEMIHSWPKRREKLKEDRTTKKKLVEVLNDRTNDENSYF